LPFEHDNPIPAAAVTIAAFAINERRDEFIVFFILNLQLICLEMAFMKKICLLTFNLFMFY